MVPEGFKRKLTSIFSADAVGYSRLMGDDEAATVLTITEYRNVISTLIKQHNGTVIYKSIICEEDVFYRTGALYSFKSFASETG
jgi:class 3 adenylate cyclase